MLFQRRAPEYYKFLLNVLNFGFGSVECLFNTEHRQKVFIHPSFERSQFQINGNNIQKIALYKHYNIEFYTARINITLSEKTALCKTKSFNKHVEKNYSTLNCHQNEHLKFFHNIDAVKNVGRGKNKN